MDKVYDVIVIGGGPGGYTAALYGARAGLSVIVLERLSAGGQMSLTHEIENYPGFDEAIDGFELGQRMHRGAVRFGAEVKFSEVQSVQLQPQLKAVHTDSGSYYGRTVIISTGAVPRMLGVPGEVELTGRGVHYCASCDGMFYRGKTVVIVGGGNSAAAEALILSRVAKRVVLVHRRDNLRAEKALVDALLKADNVELRLNSVVTEILHEGKVRGLRVVENGDQSEIQCDGVFISIGRKPATALVEGQLELDEGGYIAAGENTRTSIPGVFAVGDVRSKEVRQIITAAADGAVAIHEAQAFFAD